MVCVRVENRRLITADRVGGRYRLSRKTENIPMIKSNPFGPRLGMAALMAATLFAVPAYAGEETRAVAAIAEASGKIDAGDKAGAADQAPDLQRQARQALMTAQDLLAHHQKEQALAAATQASALADQALVVATKRQAVADQARRDNMRDAEARAQQAAAAANARAETAEQAKSEADSRAAAAEQATAAANAQAEALRNAPPVAPAPTTTTVALTQHDTAEAAPATVHHVGHHVVHHPRQMAHAKVDHDKTTTAVVTTTNR